MKTELDGLRKGETVVAKVFEKISEVEFIVSISSQLIQVLNQTGQQFELGAQVDLLVTNIRPLQLQFIDANSAKDFRASKRALDISV